MANNMASSVLWENVIPTKLILIIHSTNGYAKRDTWCQDVRHQLVMLQSYIPNKCWWCRHSMWAPLCCWWAGVVGHVQWAWLTWEGESIWGGGQGCWTRPHTICVVAGTCQCAYWGMDHSLLWTLPPWWSWWWYLTPYALWRKCQIWCDDLRC